MKEKLLLTEEHIAQKEENYEQLRCWLANRISEDGKFTNPTDASCHCGSGCRADYNMD